MKAALVYNPGIRKYDFGEGHPFRGGRFEGFMDFFRSEFRDYFQEIKPDPATDEILSLVHSKEYVEVMKSASEGVFLKNITEFTSGDNLNPLTGYIPRGIDEGARVSVGTSVLAGELVAAEKFRVAVGVGGGLHHAKRGYGEGFCIYNDVAVCAENLKQKYNLERILILDTDAHAGNGTSEIFYDDPSILFIDLHQDPRTIYPGTGGMDEIGSDKGKGFTVNLPLLSGTGDDAYQYLFGEVISPLAEEFKPELIIRYGGSDPYYLDGLTNLGLTLRGFRMIGERVREIAGRVCQGKEVDLLGSGYNLKILPYAWSALISGLLDLDINLDLPEENPPPKDSGLEYTVDMVERLKKGLEGYWGF
ncbi:MAG: hypothetical protein U9Q22_01650 [Candidatus Altiarchaeota archaeon]|nr:hypothetical protein [Candidatus Altiarchaeota archaeon]